MKAVTQQCPTQEFGLKTDHCKISKHKLENSDVEMQACFSKLKDLVPTVPQDKKVSKVQLLQHVIDYIMDLEVTLDDDSDSPTLTPVVLTSRFDRKPLTESLHLNTLKASELLMEDSSTCAPATC